MNNNKSKLYVIGFGIFITIIGVVFAYLFSAFNRTEAKVNGYQLQVEEIKACVNEMKTDIGVIKNDLGWIKSAINKSLNIK